MAVTGSSSSSSYDSVFSLGVVADKSVVELDFESSGKVEESWEGICRGDCLSGELWYSCVPHDMGGLG